MRIVRNRSIPHVDDARLIADRATLHDRFHTTAGLHRFDGPRRNLIDNGVKVRLITAELRRRGHPDPACRFCTPDV